MNLVFTPSIVTRAFCTGSTRGSRYQPDTTFAIVTP